MQGNTILQQVQRLGRHDALTTPIGERKGRPSFLALLLSAIIALLIAILPLEFAVVLVVGTILATLVFIEPRWGLYILPFTIPFGSIYDVPLGPAMIGITELLLALFFVAWAARGVVRRNLTLKPPPLLHAFALWYGIMIFSLWSSTSLALSVKELIKWGEVLALYTIAADELRHRDIAIILATTLLAGALAGLEGIYQSWYLIGPDSFQFSMGGDLWLRAYGRFTQPNPYAGYLGLVLPFAYGIIAVKLGLGELASTEDDKDEWIEKIILSMPRALSRFVQHVGLISIIGGCALIILVALILSLSRGGMIAAIVAAIVMGGLLNRRMAGISLVIAGGGALAIGLNAIVLLPSGLEKAITDLLQYANFLFLDVRTIALTPENFSVLERLVHWDAAYGMWADALWLGQGVGNYGAVYADYRIAPWDEALGHAHNLFLNTLAETGIIGLLAYLFFWGHAFSSSFRAIRLNQGIWRGVALGTFGALIHLHTHNLFDNLYVHGVYLHLALILAMIAILTQPDSSHDSRKKYDSTKATSQNRSTSLQS